jgi:hypothetical protein
MKMTLSKFYSYFNPHLNQGKEWVECENNLSEVETVRGFTTDVRQLSVEELAPTWALELAELYFGPDGFDGKEDLIEMAKWIGPGGPEVAKKLFTMWSD